MRHLRSAEFLVAPRGIPHSYVVVSDDAARGLAISNGGFDRFIEEVSVPAAEPTLAAEPHLPPDERRR